MYNMYNSLKRFEESGDRSIDRSIAVQSTGGKLPAPCAMESWKITKLRSRNEMKKKKRKRRRRLAKMENVVG